MLKVNLSVLITIYFLIVLERSSGFIKFNSLYSFRTKKEISKSVIFGEIEKSNELENETGLLEEKQINDETRLRLKVELEDPLRLLRNYVYFAMVGGGGLGTLVTLPLFIKLVMSQNYEDLKTASLNLAINLGGVIGGGWLFFREKRQEEQKLEKMRLKEQQYKNKLSIEDVEKREALIDLLPVELLLSANTSVIKPFSNPSFALEELSITNETASRNGQYSRPVVTKTETTRTVSIKDLREKGKQSIIITAGDYNYIRKCLIDLRLKDQEVFSNENIMIIPFCSSITDQQRLENEYSGEVLKNSQAKKGFQTEKTLSQPALAALSAGFIGHPTQLEIWKKALDQELELAEKQGVQKSKKQGISLIINNKGKIIRRGIGIPIWESVIEELKTNNKNKP